MTLSSLHLPLRPTKPLYGHKKTAGVQKN